MSTAGGPRLAGIGRSGDSDIVLCMDAHDAGSYPGEPTLNVMKNGYFPGTDTTTTSSGWTINGTAGIVTFREGGEEFFYKGLGLSNPRVLQFNGVGYYNDTNSGYIVQSNVPNETSTVYAISFWYRFTGQNSAQLSNQYIKLDLDGGITDPGNPLYTDYGDTEWHYYSQLETSHASTSLFTVYFYGNTYSNCPGGSYYEIAGFQVEAKGYSTPFVGDGQSARPASTNLMIHGDVGTGQTFSDSSPSKHTITANGDVTHSTAQSKFSGGSIYFDGSDSLQMADSADWNFGAGDYTFDCWIYPTAVNIYGGIINQGEDSSNQQLNSLMMYTGGTGQIRWLIRNSSATNQIDITTASSSIAINTKWYHIAAVKSGTSYKIYIDGVEGASGTQATAIEDLTWPMHIGRRAVDGGANYYYQGYMDEVRITKGTALWTSVFTPPTRRNLNGPVVDLSGHDNAGNFATTDMTDVATYRDGQVIEPVASAVWDFDGTDDYTRLKSPTFASDLTGAISIWARAEALGDSLVSFSKPSTGVVDEMRLGYYTANKVQFVIYKNGSGDLGFTTNADAISLGQWHHITCVNDGSFTHIYVDGVNVKSDAGHYWWGDLTTDADTFTIGALERSGTLYLFNGRIGNLAIYSAPLTAQQVKQNFNSQRSRFKV
jgi:hypothetical protein